MRVFHCALLLATLLAGPVWSEQAAPGDPERLTEEWADVLYCLEVFRHPGEGARPDRHDTGTCERAEAAIVERVASFDERSRNNLELAARQRMRILLAKTREITEQVDACRQTCAALAPTHGDVQ